MKPTHFTHLFLAALSVAAAMSATSCNKYSQGSGYEKDLPGCAFTLTAEETRGTDHILPWTISKDGKTDSIEESLDEMYVTAHNAVVVKATAEGSGFQGVNVRSSNPKAVQIEAVDDSRFMLRYVGEGKATVEVWNGSGSGQYKTAFEVNAKEIINVEKVIWMLDDKELECHLFNSSDKVIEFEKTLINEDARSAKFDFSFAKLFDNHENNDETRIPSTLHHLRFGRIVPENASFRSVHFVARYFYWDRADTQTNRNWPNFVKENFGVTFNWANYDGDVAGLNADVYLGASGHCYAQNLSVDVLFRSTRHAFCPFEMQLFGGAGTKPVYSLLYFSY